MISIFISKKRKLKAIEKWIKNNPSQGYYIAGVTDQNLAPLIGNAYGPMGPGRYCTIEQFYKTI